MKKNRPRASVKQMSGLFGKTRQAWYKATKRTEQQQMQALLVVQKVKQIRKELPHCGVRKLYYLLGDFLRRHQIKLGRDKLFALLSEHNLLIKRKKTRRTTFSYHHFRKYPNIIKKLEVVRSNQLWVSDITYISLGASFAYLSLITDAYSRKIIGWSLQENLSATGPLNALSQALKQRPTTTLKFSLSNSSCCASRRRSLCIFRLDENSSPFFTKGVSIQTKSLLF